MQIKKREIILKLETETGESTLRFKPLKKNVVYKHQAQMNALLEEHEERRKTGEEAVGLLGTRLQVLTNEREQAILASCFEVRDLELDSEEISLDDLQGGNVDDYIINAIIQGYNVAANPSVEQEEKNEQGDSLSGSDTA